MRIILMLLALPFPAHATDFLKVDKVDAERLTITVRVPRTATTYLQTFQSSGLGGGTNIPGFGTTITPFVVPDDLIAVYSLRKGTYFSGDGKELSADPVLKRLKPGSILVVGDEELRAGVKGGVFKPETIILIRAGGSPAKR